MPLRESEPLFVYGTLRFPEVLQALLGRVPNRAPAEAPGLRVVALPGRVYPGLIPGAGIARGLLLTGLTVREQRVLDDFEGPEYERRRIGLGDGRHAAAYLWDPDADHLDEEWSPQDFARRHLDDYVDRLGGSAETTTHPVQDAARPEPTAADCPAQDEHPAAADYPARDGRPAATDYPARDERPAAPD
ncbi:gamma-glutamylcyclotransferase [Actinomadura craniellae]|uniref:Putative gamma-glutamylcyclotransferase n=1 Tax=Actinomadura craniellae TaxID=2231787 RepID=A0A365H7A1_9ACTN|nr:gamma-glutamylcyclotransferase family protein [Actinomadura craniellae]RAY14951.1 gamma-glutamylcyclotransferase [Actinomadura craniellae]